MTDLAFQVYHSSYASTISEIEDTVKFCKLELNDDDIFQTIGVNTNRPKDGETVRFSLDLYSQGELLDIKLHAQVYCWDTKYSRTFELNAYIN